MKTSVVVLLACLAIVVSSCEESNPIQSPPIPTISGKWFGRSPADGTNPLTTIEIQVVFSQQGDTLFGTGEFLNLARFAVDINGVVSYPNVSFNMKWDGYPATNFTGKLISNDTLYGRLNGYVSAETPINLIRQY